MDSPTFEKILVERLKKTSEVLTRKNKEYGADDDRLYNFHRAAKINNTTSAKALWGMATKHLISVIDMVEGKLPVELHTVDEKIGDMINYLILLEAVFHEDMNALSSLWEELEGVRKEIEKDLATAKSGSNNKTKPTDSRRKGKAQ